MNRREKEHPKLLDDDFIRDALTELLDGKVGQGYPDVERNEIYKTGKERYENNTPPGYMDAKDKTGKSKFGDLVLWFQMLDEAKEKKRPIIFVTDDAKEDWWRILNGKTLGPRPELIAEMHSKAEVQFYAYQVDRFIHFASLYLKRDLKQDAINEAKSIRQKEDSSISEIFKMYQMYREYLDNIDKNANALTQGTSLETIRRIFKEEQERRQLLEKAFPTALFPTITVVPYDMKKILGFDVTEANHKEEDLSEKPESEKEPEDNDANE